jgi:hypothetical protein
MSPSTSSASANSAMRTPRALQLSSRRFGLVLILALVLTSSVPVGAVVCSVPGSHATIQEAIYDSACTEINLSDQTYAESILVPRSLTIAGPGAGTAILEGGVEATGSGTLVTMTDLEVRNGCQPEAFSAERGGRVEGTGLVVVRSAALPCPPVIADIFSDGFESGDTSAWSSTVP